MKILHYRFMRMTAIYEDYDWVRVVCQVNLEGAYYQLLVPYRQLQEDLAKLQALSWRTAGQTMKEERLTREQAEAKEGVQAA